MRFPFCCAILSGKLRISSGVCVAGVMPNESEMSELGSGLKDILGTSLATKSRAFSIQSSFREAVCVSKAAEKAL